MARLCIVRAVNDAQGALDSDQGDSDVEAKPRTDLGDGGLPMCGRVDYRNALGIRAPFRCTIGARHHPGGTARRRNLFDLATSDVDRLPVEGDLRPRDSRERGDGFGPRCARVEHSPEKPELLRASRVPPFSFN